MTQAVAGAQIADPSARNSRPRLEVRDIGVSFSGVVALDGVSLSASPGEVLGLIGPNGAGKTTLFDVISGLRAPDSGTLRFDGQDITARSPVWRARAGMRRTFQRQQVFGRLTVEENLLCATEWRGGGGGILADFVRFPTRLSVERRRRSDAQRIVELCGLERVRSAMAGSLPIGTARMVELGRALMEMPSLLLLDEPTSGLGEVEAERLGSVITSLKRERTCTVLLVEHDISFVMAHCERIVVLQRGSVLAVGTPQAVQANQEVRNAYLG